MGCCSSHEKPEEVNTLSSPQPKPLSAFDERHKLLNGLKTSSRSNLSQRNLITTTPPTARICILQNDFLSPAESAISILQDMNMPFKVVYSLKFCKEYLFCKTFCFGFFHNFPNFMIIPISKIYSVSILK